MGGISAERSLHTLQGNDHCDPEYPKPSVDPTCAPTSVPTPTVYPFGVQLNSVTAAQLDSYGCSECYLKTYGTVTTPDDIRGCTGPYLFVGGRAIGSSSFKLGAFDTSTVILTQTFVNTPHLSNGVYWYFTPSFSFGFSRNALIYQSGGDMESIDGDARLSWHLDIGGGFRLGQLLTYPYLNFANDYMKAIYNCPA